MLSLLLLLFLPLSLAQTHSCSTDDNSLSVGTYRLANANCTTIQYCHAANRTTLAGPGYCRPKGCRIGEYASGYTQYELLPPRCPSGQFCPDEGDTCLPLIPVDESCQLARDDQCEPPPSSLSLSNDRNWNGALCLNFKCVWANATLGQSCVLDNRAYIGYLSTGSEFATVVSRDNCATNLYCNGQTRLCVRQKSEGSSCEGNKECRTYNCLAKDGGTCGPKLISPESLTTLPRLATLLTALLIPILILLISYALLRLHVWLAKRRLEDDRNFREELSRARARGYGTLEGEDGGKTGEGERGRKEVNLMD